MEFALSILLLLLVGAWLGYREIGVSFLGIHIRDLISTRLFGFLLFIVAAVLCLLVLFISDETASGVNNLSIGDAYKIMCSMAMTVAIVRSADQYTSAVTAFWGATAALAYHGDWAFHPTITAALLSIVAAPLLGLLLFYIYERVFDHIIFNTDRHLLLKNLLMKRLALGATILGGLTLAVNFALFSSPILSSFLTQIDVTWLPFLFMFLALLSMVTVVPTTAVLRHENSMAKPMSWALPSLYALITVLLLGNLGGTLLLGMTPVVVSPSQLRECSKMTKGARRRSLINLSSITIATPLIAFLLVTAMTQVVVSPLIIAITTCFVLTTCLLVILYSKQWHKHNITKQALDDELSHSTEAGDERNRMDVAAVTSQFNVMTSEIDIKHKELVNLSLYIKQQRQYLEDLSKGLNDLSQEEDVALLRQKLRETAQKLNENMRLTGEMDQFYTQVEGLHKNFVSRLLMRCPNLSEKEKRLAIMLRLGFSSKDISGMMNVEPKSVEVSRYRFRRKLKLDRSVNIVEYLQMI